MISKDELKPKSTRRRLWLWFVLALVVPILALLSFVAWDCEATRCRILATLISSCSDMTNDEVRAFAERKLSTSYAGWYVAQPGALHSAQVRIDKYDPTDPVIEVMFAGQGSPIAGLRIYKECETDFLRATYVR